MAKPRLEWWAAPDDDNVWAAYSRVKNLLSPRQENIRLFIRLYGNRNYSGMGPLSVLRTDTADRLTLNVVKAACDTVTNKIAQSKPRARFLTSRGNWSMRRKAKTLEQWVDTQFYLTQLHRHAPKAFLDCCVTGDGWLKVYRCHDRPEIKVERVFPGDILVDPVEGIANDPKTMYQTCYLPRSVLREMFPKKTAIIDAAAPLSADFLVENGFTSDGDRIEVCEAWHIDESKGGSHVIAIAGGVLEAADWEHPWFPFLRITWNEPMRGYYGQGLVEELIGIQTEINQILIKIQKGLKMFASPQLWVEASSGVQPNRLTNKIGATGTYTTRPPVLLNPPVFPPEVYMHLERLYNKAFEIAGVNQAVITGNVPNGVDSAPAQREWESIRSERFALKSLAWDDLHLDAARKYVAFGREMAKAFPKWRAVAARDKNTIEEVKWKTVDLTEDAYVLKMFPTSSLPTHPTGRLAAVGNMLQNQLTDPREARRLLGFPDLEAEQDLEEAATENIDRIVEKILDDGDYEPPEPFIDTQLALKRAHAFYQRAVCMDVPEPHLQLLRQWTVAVSEIENRRRAALAAEQAGAPPMPGPPTIPNGMSGQSMMAAGGQQ